MHLCLHFRYLLGSFNVLCYFSFEEVGNGRIICFWASPSYSNSDHNTKNFNLSRQCSPLTVTLVLDLETRCQTYDMECLTFYVILGLIGQMFRWGAVKFKLMCALTDFILINPFPNTVKHYQRGNWYKASSIQEMFIFELPISHILLHLIHYSMSEKIGINKMWPI